MYFELTVDSPYLTLVRQNIFVGENLTLKDLILLYLIPNLYSHDELYYCK